MCFGLCTVACVGSGGHGGEKISFARLIWILWLGILPFQNCDRLFERIYNGPAEVDLNTTVGSLVVVRNNATKQFFASKLTGSSTLCGKYQAFTIGNVQLYNSLNGTLINTQ